MSFKLYLHCTVMLIFKPATVSQRTPGGFQHPDRIFEVHVQYKIDSPDYISSKFSFPKNTREESGIIVLTFYYEENVILTHLFQSFVLLLFFYFS